MKPSQENFTLDDSAFVRLECIRGIAATFVVLNHARGWLWAGLTYVRSHGGLAQYSLPMKIFAGFNLLTRCGQEFVVLFFVLSGFSIAHSLRNGGRLGRFYQRRFIRLYPPYLAALAWGVLVYVVARELAPALFDGGLPGAGESLSGMSSPVEPYVLLGYLVYARNEGLFAQFWSLSHEVIHYILFPHYFRVLRLYMQASLLMYLLGWFLDGSGVVAGGVLYRHFFLYNLYFVIGIFLREHFSLAVSLVGRMRRGWLWSVVVVLFVVMVSLNGVIGGGRVTGLIASGIAVLLVIQFVLMSRVPSVLVFLGFQSYSLYLTHLATVALAVAVYVRLGGEYPIVAPWLWVFVVPFAILIAQAFFLFVEAPTRRVLARLRGPRPSVSVAGGA